MGTGGGGSFSSDPSDVTTLISGMRRLAKHHRLDAEGRFGIRVSKKTSELHTQDPLGAAQTFWGTLSTGAHVTNKPTGYGDVHIAQFSDQSVIVWRPITSSSIRRQEDNPAIDFDIKTPAPGLARAYRLYFKRGTK